MGNAAAFGGERDMGDGKCKGLDELRRLFRAEAIPSTLRLSMPIWLAAFERGRLEGAAFGRCAFVPLAVKAFDQ